MGLLARTFRICEPSSLLENSTLHWPTDGFESATSSARITRWSDPGYSSRPSMTIRMELTVLSSSGSNRRKRTMAGERPLLA